MNLQFRSGAIGQLDLNGLEMASGTRGVREWVKVVGVQAHVICEEMQRVRYCANEDWIETVPTTGRYYHDYDPAWTGIARSPVNFGYLGEVEHFALRCLGQVEGGPDLWDSYESLRLGEAVYDSTESGRPVEIPPRG